MKLFSPAKINLFLRVLGRRPDGYHNLASLFQAVTLGDELCFELGNRDQLTCTDPTLPTDKSNLVLKAADLFRHKTGLSFGLKVHLEKRIPSQAGLGGGSSNAATTLWALNKLFGEPAKETELAAWSSEIGSDIPFFFSQGTAYCTGRGEQIKALKPPAQIQCWLVKPPQGLSTPLVYSKLDLARLQNRDPDKALKAFLEGEYRYFNDLESAAFSAMPALSLLKQELIALGFHSVVMTGSGSGFFCTGAPHRSLPAGLFVQQVFSLNRPSGEWYVKKDKG